MLHTVGGRRACLAQPGIKAHVKGQIQVRRLEYAVKGWYSGTVRSAVNGKTVSNSSTQRHLNFTPFVPCCIHPALTLTSPIWGRIVTLKIGYSSPPPSGSLSGANKWHRRHRLISHCRLTTVLYLSLDSRHLAAALRGLYSIFLA
jgi:hypothetical protein